MSVPRRLGAAFGAVVFLAPVAFAAAQGTESEPGPGATDDPARSFELTRARAKPSVAFFDARRTPELRYRFRADLSLDVRIELVKGRSGKVVRRWVNRDASPGERHERSWNGTNRRGRAMPDGRYSYRLAPTGRRTRRAAGFQHRRHRFPVPGRHSYREGEGEFGAGRSGGRVHEGKDVWAPCGSAIVAARGGRVQQRGYDPSLYGHFLVVDVRGTRADHFYVHLAGRSPAGRAERVRTGERIGSIGRSGNATSVGCMLHFELWPRGFRRGSPTDPERQLRRWDRWS